MTDIAVKGLAELNAALQALPVSLEKGILKRALYQGAKVIRDEAKRIVHIAPPNGRNVKLYGGKPGALQSSIRAGVDVKQGKAVAYVRAGRQGKQRKGKGANAYYAIWVEYGTAAHWITVTGSGKVARQANLGKPRALSIAGNAVATVHHPGAKPQPYMRPALDKAAPAAVKAAAEYIKGKLAEKLQGLDLSGIEIGGQEE